MRLTIHFNFENIKLFRDEVSLDLSGTKITKYRKCNENGGNIYNKLEQYGDAERTVRLIEWQNIKNVGDGKTGSLSRRDTEYGWGDRESLRKGE